MIKNWLKSESTLTWIRLWTATSLVLLFSWLFFDMRIRIIAMLIPFTYSFNTQKNIAMLFVPLLLNMALWIPDKRSYLFIRVVLYAEIIRLIYVTLLIVPAALFALISGSETGVILLIFLLLTLFAVNKIMIYCLDEDQNKLYFHAESQIEPNLKWTIRKLTVLFLALVVLLIFTGKNIPVPTLLSPFNYSQSYTKVETYKLYHKELKYSVISPKGGEYIEYRTTPKYDISYKSKLDKNGRLLLIRMSSMEDEGKDLFIFDTVTMKNTHILQTPIVEKGERTRSGYTFTNDSKYIVVGDEFTKNAKIKFQVINIATGQRDNRFSDTKNLSKINLSSRIKSVGDIKFNPSGQYFAVIMEYADIIEIWDYKSGQLVFTDRYPEDMNDFTWLNDNSFLVSCYESHKPRIGSVMQYSILESGIVEKVKKERLSAEMSADKLNSWEIANSNNKGDYIVTLAHKERRRFIPDTLSIWDVKDEKKLLEAEATGVIKGVEFHPDGRRVVVFEVLLDRSGKFTLWDIETAKKEQEILIAPLTTDDNIYKNYKMKIIDNGTRIMIIEDAIHFISL